VAVYAGFAAALNGLFVVTSILAERRLMPMTAQPI
jgi:hypothetical protein